MKFYLICDNEDTAVGMRLAGIQGTVVTDTASVANVLEKVLRDGETGIVLINEALAKLSAEQINNFRKLHNVPVIVEIPDKNSDGVSDSISDYVRKAIGINI
ncbi:MAG: V-type ATP synthase subunit F [Ruminococcus sp.]|nr:V-type ATP synthase subunit F [Candidatus Copronaster equi]